MVHLRIAKCRIFEWKGTHSRSHTAWTSGLLESMVEKLLQNHYAIREHNNITILRAHTLRRVRSILRSKRFGYVCFLLTFSFRDNISDRAYYLLFTTGRATNIAYIGPSVTPYDNLNPGYRIYYVDGDHDSTTRLVIDHENWIMNLKEANLYDYPIWYKLYSTRLAYSMRGLRPQDWDELINTMTNNDEMFDLYYK